MIISHKHKYLFVELPRTGTTAIHDELIKHYDGEEILNKHSTYRDFLKIATEEEKKYFVFSCIRNPMDRIVSLYLKLKNPAGQFKNPHYRKSKSISALIFNRRLNYIHKYNPPFSEYFKKFYKMPYDDWSSLDHHRFNFLLRFENLNDDFKALLKKIGLEEVRELPIVNKTNFKNKYLEYFTPDTYKRACKVFGPFMSKFGYEFPPEWGSYNLTKWDFFKYNIWSSILKIYWKSELRKPKLK
jgi:hypothetical protein